MCEGKEGLPWNRGKTVHPQLSYDGFPMDGALLGAWSHNPLHDSIGLHLGLVGIVGAGRNYFDLIPIWEIQWVDKWFEINLIGFTHVYLRLEMLEKILGIECIRTGILLDIW